MQKSFVRNPNGIGSDAQSGCCRRQPGVKSQKKEEESRRKNRDKGRGKGERTLDDNPKRGCETLECKLGIQVERGRYSERGCTYRSLGPIKIAVWRSGVEIPWQGRKFLRPSFLLRASDLTRTMFHRYNDGKEETGETRGNSSARLSTAIHFWTRMGTRPTVIFKSSLYWPRL